MSTHPGPPPFITVLENRTVVVWPDPTRSRRLQRAGVRAVYASLPAVLFSAALLVTVGLQTVLATTQSSLLDAALVGLALLGSSTLLRWGLKRRRRSAVTTLTYDALGLHLGITEHLAYVDIAAMGATQHSIWFDTDHEGRVEVRMDGLDPARIQAVAGEIEAHWAPRRGGVTDGLEQTRKRAAQIAALTANP